MLTRIGVAAQLANPSFLAVTPNHQFLYAITEAGDAARSMVSAFSIDLAAWDTDAGEFAADGRRRTLFRGG